MLDRLIAENKEKIRAIIASYNIPLTEIKARDIPKDDD